MRVIHKYEQCQRKPPVNGPLVFNIYFLDKVLIYVKLSVFRYLIPLLYCNLQSLLNVNYSFSLELPFYVPCFEA